MNNLNPPCSQPKCNKTSSGVGPIWVSIWWRYPTDRRSPRSTELLVQISIFFCQNLLSTRSSVDHIFGSQCTRAWSRVLDPVWSVWSSGFFASELRGWMLDRFFLFLVGQVHAQRLSISVMNPVNCDLKAGDCGPLIESWSGMQMKGGGVKSDFFISIGKKFVGD